MPEQSNRLAEKFRLPDKTRVGPPVLRVKDLEDMLSFYRDTLGLRINHRERDRIDELEYVELGFGKVGDTLLALKQDQNATETPHDFAGLYHFAILVPDRKSLAQAYSGIERSQVRFDGFGDHLVSESLYLHDPERNGIEIYRDRPQTEWIYEDGKVRMDTLPLDLDGILRELSPEERGTSEVFPSGARIGHMHLRVTDLERSASFYHEKLGFNVTADWSSMGAMFLSAGGYHHHIGLNTWHSLGGRRHETGEAGLDSFTIEIPSDHSPMNELESSLGSAVEKKLSEKELLVSDPDGIKIMIRSH
ncbi:MAG: VOC family protein [Nitrososphaerota archaeon]|nr:VOC family protein [Nitrososphaerota archaeon]